VDVDPGNANVAVERPIEPVAAVPTIRPVDGRTYI
jgi:hypothetical protein